LKVIVVVLDFPINGDSVGSQILKLIVFDALRDVLDENLPIMVAASYKFTERYAKFFNKSKVCNKAFILKLGVIHT